MTAETETKETREETLKQKIGKLLEVLLDKSVLSPETREKIEEVLGGICLGENIFVDIIHAIRDTASKLIDRAPYLSDDQSNALSTDLEELFNKLADDIDLSDVVDPIEYFEKKCQGIKGKIGTQGFPFELKKIPRDIYEAAEDSIEGIVKGVIEDVFGQLINNLPPDDRLRLGIKIENAVSQNISRLK